MLTDLQRDILVKSAEGIQEGMWCRGDAFSIMQVDGFSDGGFTSARALFQDRLTMAEASASKRCATGEIAYRTVLAGADWKAFDEIVDVVGCWVARSCPSALHKERVTLEDQITHHNDHCMKALDSFSAGHEWARIFREVADA